MAAGTTAKITPPADEWETISGKPPADEWETVAGPAVNPGKTPAERTAWLRSHPEAQRANVAGVYQEMGLDPQGNRPAPQTSWLERGLGGLVSPVTGPVKEVFTWATDPKKWRQQYVASQGDPLSSGMMPFGAGESQVRQLVGGDVAGAVGSTIGQAAMTAGQMKLAGPKLVDELGASVTGRAAEVGTAAKRMVTGEVDPHLNMVRALRPAAKNVNFEKNLPLAMPELKAAEQVIGRPIENIADLRDAIQPVKQNLWKQFKSFGGLPYAKMDAVADSMVKSIPEQLRFENPKLAERLESEANLYRGQVMTIDKIDNFLRTTNAELNGYYAKYPIAQRKALRSDPYVAAREAKAVAMRDVLYDAMEPKAAGVAGRPRQMMKLYGAVLDIEGEVDRRYNVAMRQAATSLPERGGKILGAYHMLKGAMSANPTEFIAGMGEAAYAKFLKEQGTTDSLIKSAFQNYKGTPVAFTPPAPFAPRGLLTEGTIKTSPPEDTSYVRGAPGMAHPPSPRRALPAPADIHTPPPPDTSFVRGAPGMTQPPRTSRALPPASTIVTPPPGAAEAEGVTPGRMQAAPSDPSFVTADKPSLDRLAHSHFGLPWESLTEAQRARLLKLMPKQTPGSRALRRNQ